MSMPRILSTHGNVTAVDFRSYAPADITFTARTCILHADEHVILGRYEFYLGDELQARRHYLIDRHADTVTQL